MQSVADYLFAERNANVYAILDGASVEELVDQLYRHEPEFVCLYRGELEPDITEVAPYLVQLDRKSAFTDWVFESGWGSHWGVFAVTRADLATVRHHFRRFLIVHDTGGKPMLFRYYDPRVLRMYLPTCDGAQLEEIFGPVLSYVLEGEERTELVRFQFVGGSLQCHTKNLNKDQ